jgi:hypothetical protein
MSDGHFRLNRSAGNTGSKQKDVSYVYYESFEGARAIVRKLKLGSQKAWRAWRSKSGQRPSNIPSCPDEVYRGDGWISWPDWLGYRKGQQARAVGKMLPFATARAIVRKRKLKDWSEWQAWSKTGERPSNVPCNPYRAYCGKGWISLADWLGCGKGKARAKGRGGKKKKAGGCTAGAAGDS